MTHEPLTIDDISTLLALCAARDQRTIGRADTLAWWQDLNQARITKTDAEAAISRYYAVEWPRQDPTQRFRITAPVIIEMVNKARAGRLEGFVYQADPNETGSQYIARRREQITAVANGQTPEDQAAPAIMRPRPVAALVAGVGDARRLPPEIAEILDRRRPRAQEVPCPWEPCRARAGLPCTRLDGRTRDPHPSRVDAWAIAAVACPNCRAAIGDPCRVPTTGDPYPHGAHRERHAAAKDTAA